MSATRFLRLVLLYIEYKFIKNEVNSFGCKGMPVMNSGAVEHACTSEADHSLSILMMLNILISVPDPILSAVQTFPGTT